MMNVNEVDPKLRRRPGRPATGSKPLIGFRAPPDLIEALDDVAGRKGLTRAGAIRMFVEAGLRGEKPGQPG